MATVTTQQLLKSGASALESLPSHIDELTKLLSETFNKRPSELRKEYAADIQKQENFQNGSLNTLKEKIEDLSTDSMDMLSDLNVWIQLLVPKIEDGGNFGVRVQFEFIKRIGSSIKEVSGVYSTIASYHEKRAGLVEKVSSSTKTVKTKTNTVKAIEEGKTGESENVVETVTEGKVNPEQFQALASLDLKLFLDLKDSVRIQRDLLLVIRDFADKNKSKVFDPKSLTQSIPGYIV